MSFVRNVQSVLQPCPCTPEGAYESYEQPLTLASGARSFHRLSYAMCFEARRCNITSVIRWSQFSIQTVVYLLVTFQLVCFFQAGFCMMNCHNGRAINTELAVLYDADDGCRCCRYGSHNIKQINYAIIIVYFMLVLYSVTQMTFLHKLLILLRISFYSK